METIETLIAESDSLITKESRKYSEIDMDRLLVVCSHLFDIYSRMSENSSVSELKHKNKIDGEFIELKEMTIDGKKVHTDKTAQAFLNGKYEDEDIVYLKNKFLFKLIENKLKLLERKENLVKKHFKT